MPKGTEKNCEYINKASRRERTVNALAMIVPQSMPQQLPTLIARFINSNTEVPSGTNHV
jgi:hypothetical protein